MEHYLDLLCCIIEILVHGDVVGFHHDLNTELKNKRER